MVVTFATKSHNSTYKVNIKLKTVEQAQKDLKTTVGDVKTIKMIFEKYGYDPEFKGPNGVSFDLCDPTW